MNPVCYSSAPRRESCLVKGPVFGQNIYICSLSSLDGSMSIAGLIHTNGSHDCCSGPGCGLVPTSVTCWPQGKNSQRGELLRVSENSLLYIEAHVLSHVCSLCASILTVHSMRLCSLVGSAVHCFSFNI